MPVFSNVRAPADFQDCVRRARRGRWLWNTEQVEVGQR